MQILKVYTDPIKLKKHLYSLALENDKWVVNFHDFTDHHPTYGEVELGNGIRFQFRLLRTLTDAHRQISGFRFPFVEYHSDDVPQEVKDFILSRIRDPRDYS